MGQTHNHRLHLHQHPQQHHHHHLARDAGVDGDGYNEGEKGECCGDRGEDGRGHLMIVGNSNGDSDGDGDGDGDGDDVDEDSENCSDKGENGSR